MDPLKTILQGRQMLFVTVVFFLSMAETSAVESAATGRRRALSAHNSTASVDSATTSQKSVLQWVQITVVPLGVFLLGACIRGIIHNTAVSWRLSFNGFGGGPSEAADEVPGDNRLTANRRDAHDLERGECEVELEHRHMDARDAALNAPVPRDEMQPELIDVSNA